MRITPDKRSLGSVVNDAYRGKICLPNFQRSFVWKREEVADLVRSVLRQYYIGSLLLLRVDPERPPFAPIAIRGAQPITAEVRPEYLALDGQQRLTSLVYALTAPDLRLKDSSKRRWFFVDLDLLILDPEDNEIVFDRSDRDIGDLLNQEAQYAQHVLPCTELFDLGRFMRWKDGLDDWLRTNRPEEHDLFRNEWRDLWTDAVTAFHHFDVPYVEISQVRDDDPEAVGRVCAIFEKLNSTGVDLSVYDLLTARLYRHGIRLHDLWDESTRLHARLKKWSKGKADHRKFGVLVLRTLALLRDLDPKPRILINLQPKDFDADWRRAAMAIERALELLEHIGSDGFGVFAEKWLPGFGLIPTLAALRATVEDHKLGGDARSDIRRWYWSNVFLERYSSAVESKSRKDYAEFTRRWFKDGPPPSVFAEAQAVIGSDGFTVRESASFASAVYSGIFCLLALRGARDWRRVEAIELQNLEDHHIYPRAYLKRHEITTRLAVNSVANRTLISDETNRLIRDRAPGDYVRNGDIFPTGARAVGEPHFLIEAVLDTMERSTDGLSNDEVAALLQEFTALREAEIIVEIRARCGVETRQSPPPSAAAEA